MGVMGTSDGADLAFDEERRREEIDLARRAHRGDVAAFDELVRRFHRAIHRFCWRMLRTADAEDVAQDAFIRAFVHFERFDPERPLLPWLMAISRRLCLDHLRRRRALTRVDATILAPPRSAAPDRAAAAREELARLDVALGELDEGPREAVMLFHVEALSYRDIAAALEVPVGTVMTWLHRGRAQLKRAIEQWPVARTTAARAIEQEPS